MANSGRITTSNAVRLLQYGLDAILKHTDRVYLGSSSKIFKRVSTNGKGFYESVMMAGMGPAGVKGEGSQMIYDSYDQSTGWHTPLVTYGKAARLTFEAIDDNVYENPVEMVSKDLIKSINVNDDMQAVYIFNNSTTSAVTYRDGKVLGASDHPTQAGPTFDNRLVTDLTSDALEAAIIKIDNFVNEDGILGDYDPQQIIVPTALRFVAKRLLNSPYTPEDANNSINVVNSEGEINSINVWKRLTSSTRYFITTDCGQGQSQGFVMADKSGISTEVFKDPHTRDTICNAVVRRMWTVDDPRCVVVCGT